MNDYLLMVMAGTVIFLAALLVWLLREHKKLRQECRQLSAQLQRTNDDVAGLCSAAVAVDQQLASNAARIDGLLDVVHSYRQPIETPKPEPVFEPAVQDEPTQGYDNAIQKIRRGAGVEELVKDCGLSHDEAVLLLRLHGGKR